MNYKNFSTTLILIVLIFAFVLGGCTSEPGETIIKEVEVMVAGPTITFWSFENQPARAEKTQEIIADFTEMTGINVELVLIDQSSMDSIMASNFAANTLPDIVFVPVTLVGGWYADGILDAVAASSVIESLDAGTFSEGALSMVSVDEGYSAVPSDGWGQLLIYRKDLFEKFGLDAPTDYEKILNAAKTLEENGYIGIMAGTDPGHNHTQSTFEQFALANGVTLMDSEGNISLNTPAMVHAIEIYSELMMEYGPKDTATYWMQSRATYFAGQAGMVSWSPFILDDMAGLVDSILPNCSECTDDPAFLAKNSGIVGPISGPDGGPAQYGKVNYMGITTSADTEAAKQFVEFWLNDGYLRWLSVDAGGKFPMRRGTPDAPNIFVEGWSQLEVGVDRRGALSDFYSQETLDLLVEGANNLTGLGVLEGEMELVSAIYSELVFPRYVGEVMQGMITAGEAAEMIQSEVEDLQAALSD